MRAASVFAERFVIEALAGSGAVGSVFRALDQTTGERVALKVLHVADPLQERRFAREALLLAELDHPGIVRHVAHGVTGEGRPYLAMEWIDGETLSQRLARASLTVQESLTVARAAAEALGAAHRRDVVHRDVKPSNLLLVGGDLERVKLVDFGIARGAVGGEHMTVAGALLGTPGYLAPEQARGEDVDARADVFGLGSVLFRCLTGRPAFEGDEPLALLLRMVLEAAPRVADVRPDIPAEVSDLVARMMAKDRALRLRDGAEVAISIRNLGTGPALPAPRVVREPAPAITTTEQGIACLVVARAAGEPGSPAPLAEIGAAVAQRGGRLLALSDGALLVTVPEEGGVSENAVRAARIALSMQPLLAGGTIAVVMGQSVREARVPAGKVVDLAVRMVSQGVPGVRIDGGMVGLLEGRFELVKDESGFALRAEREAPGVTRTLLGKAVPCLGRDRDLAALKSAYASSIAEPAARAVIVVAPAGTGKSRLVVELQKSLLRRSESPEVWIGRADPMGHGAPFGLVAQALRAGLRIRESDPASLRHERLRERVAQRFTGDDRDRITEVLGELAGVRDAGPESSRIAASRRDGVPMADHVRRAFLDFLAAEAAVQPIVLLFEDLHWGDAATVRLVDAALAELRDRPLLVVATARPEAFDRFPRMWEARAASVLELAPLPREAAEALVRHVLGDKVTPEQRAQIAERAAGNAFFLEELIRAVARGRGGALPPTVIAMVQHRLAGLDPEARRTLRAAAVFGQTFWRGGVCALLEGEERTDTVDAQLDALLKMEIITRHAQSRFADDVELSFQHALLRDGAYAALTPEDRALGHRLAGQWLERTCERNAVVIAKHFERGGELAGAARHFPRAAQQALDANDLSAALEHAERGISCGAAGLALGELYKLRLEAHGWRGEFTEAERCGRRALSLLPRAEAAWFAAAGGLAAAVAALGHYDDLISVATDLVAQEPSGDARAAWLRALGRASALALKAGLPAGVRILEHLAAREDEVRSAPHVAACFHEAVAWRALFSGDPAGGLFAFEEAAASFELAGDTRNALGQSVSASVTRMYLGRWAEAESRLRAASRAAQRLGLHHIDAAAKHNLGLAIAIQASADARASSDRLREARAVEEDAIAAFASQGDRRLESGGRIYLARILLLQGDPAAAEREAGAVLDVTREGSPLRCTALAVFAQALLAGGRPGEAVRATEEAMRRLDAGAALDEGDALLRLTHAEALSAMGDETAAREALRAAVHRLAERVGAVSDPALRRSFLEHVPENARTSALARAWLGDDELESTVAL